MWEIGDSNINFGRFAWTNELELEEKLLEEKTNDDNTRYHADKNA